MTAYIIYYVSYDRNSGYPTRREPHGYGVIVIVVGVTTYQGEWESHSQGEG